MQSRRSDQPMQGTVGYYLHWPRYHWYCVVVFTKTSVSLVLCGSIYNDIVIIGAVCYYLQLRSYWYCVVLLTLKLGMICTETLKTDIIYIEVGYCLVLFTLVSVTISYYLH